MSADIFARNCVEVRGDGPRTLLFSHGFGCDQRAWRDIWPAFAERHRCVLLDHAGCGRAEPAAYDIVRHGSLAGYARDLCEVVAELATRDSARGRPPAPVVLVGHSVGSTIGLLAALHAPALFSRLVMLAPSPRFVDDPPDYIGGLQRDEIYAMLDLMDRNLVGWANTLAPLAMKNPERPELAHELALSFCAGDAAIGRRFAELAFLADVRAELPLLQLPSLIIQCTDDPLIPMSVGDYMHAQMADSELYLLKASGHLPHLSHPRLTVDAIRDYLSRH